MAYNGSDRRASLGGISRQTFVTNASEVFGEKAAGLFGLLYDMQRCTDSKVQLANEKIDSNQKSVERMLKDFRDQCGCRLEDCQKKFIPRVWEKIPLGLFGLIGVVATVFFLVGLGVLDLTGKIDIMGFFKMAL